MSINETVTTRIKHIPYGKVFDYSIFNDIENRPALYMSIQRLEKASKIQKFSKGKYYKIRQETAIKKSHVNDESKWKQIKKDGLIVGQNLYYKLGISTKKKFETEVAIYGGRSEVKKIHGHKIRYKNLPIKLTKDNQAIIELFDVILKKESILELNEIKYNHYVSEQLINNKYNIVIKCFTQYPKRFQSKILFDIAKYNRNFAIKMCDSLSQYRAYNLKNKIIKIHEIKEVNKNKKNIMYYSGLISLNLYKSPNSGDWHSRIALDFLKYGKSKSKFALMGREGDFETNSFFGEEGIINYENEIKKFSPNNFYNIKYVANHIRAIADMLLYSIIEDKDFKSIDLYGWLPKDEDKAKVFNMIDSIKNLLDIEKTRKINEMKEYYGTYRT